MRKKFSPWTERHRITGEAGETYGSFKVPGPQGMTLLIVASDGKEWPLEGPAWEHVSVSRVRDGRYGVTPGWGEMEFVRDLMFEEDELVLQFSVPRDNHINIHPGVLHLWKPIGVVIPLPPSVCV